MRRIAALIILALAVFCAPMPSYAVAAPASETLVGLLQRAQAAFDGHHYNLAQALFTQATVQAPANPVAWAGKARSEAYLDEYNRSVADYTIAIRYAPRDGLYYLRRGLSYFALNLGAKALSDYETASHLMPKDANPYLDIGAYYASLGDYSRAIVAQRQGVALAPTNWQAVYWLAVDELSLAQWTNAIRDYTTYIKHTRSSQDQTCACAYIERGNCYEQLNQWANAYADYQLAFSFGEVASIDYIHYGLAAFELSKYTIAVRLLTQAIQLDPTAADAYSIRGEAYHALARQSEAVADERMAQRLYTEQGDGQNAQNSGFMADAWQTHSSSATPTVVTTAPSTQTATLAPPATEPATPTPGSTTPITGTATGTAVLTPPPTLTP